LWSVEFRIETTHGGMSNSFIHNDFRRLSRRRTVPLQHQRPSSDNRIYEVGFLVSSIIFAVPRWHEHQDSGGSWCSNSFRHHHAKARHEFITSRHWNEGFMLSRPQGCVRVGGLADWLATSLCRRSSTGRRTGCLVAGANEHHLKRLLTSDSPRD
jgi:hypothetical protein